MCISDVNALKIEHGSTFSAFTSVDGRKNGLGVNAYPFSIVLHIGVDARRRPSTRIYARSRTYMRVDGRIRAWCEWAFMFVKYVDSR